MNRYFYYLLSLSTVLVVGCGKDPENTEVVPPKVKVVKLSNRTSGGDKLYFPAVAHAADRSHLSFRVAGEIVKLYVKEGDRLKKGAIIAQLDPTDYKLDVDNALARYNVVDSQYSRSKALVD
ncbi:biotin/lipoyl-binding protein, partial [Vibrio caribbeanicus]|uniref:biotin/lipoyl-binding protein n=1 Tax=Vibrio caribbeanicus TaxID=701175 RepID=UPI0030D700EC